MCSFSRGHYEKYFCEINLNLNKWLKRYLRFIISALEAILFSDEEPFVQFR